MKKRGWLWVVGAVMIVGLGTNGCQGKKATTSGLFLNSAYAQTSTTPATPATPAKPATAKKPAPALLTAKGEITAVDVEKKTFTLKEEGKEVPTVFSCSEKTVKDLKVGQKVEVSYKQLPKGTYKAIKVKQVEKTVSQGTTSKK